MPINYKLYAANWRKEIRPAILSRANNCCESCGVDNYAVGYRTIENKFISLKQIQKAYDERYYDYFDDELSNIKVEEKPIKIILTVAHLNHDIKDNRLENLKALCQLCHLNYDRNDNNYRKKLGKDYKKSLLFDETVFDDLKIN